MGEKKGQEMVGSEEETTTCLEKSVLVVLDANRNKGSVDALDWAINHIVKPKDTVVVLGLVSEVAKRPSSSCFPIQMGIGLSRICKSSPFFLCVCLCVCYILIYI